MAIEFNCTQCNTILRVDDEHRGKKARCPQCQMIMDVPLTDAEASKPSFEAETIYQQDNSGQSSLNWLMQTPDNSIFGPVRFDELEQWLAEGRISANCRLQRVGQDNWQAAAEIFPQLVDSGFQASGNQGSSSAGSYAHQPVDSHYSPPNTFASAPVQPYTGAHQRSHNGPVIILLAIVGAFFFPCAIIAWIMGNQELHAIRMGTVDPRGQSMVNLGRILGIIFTCLGIFSFFGFCCCIPQIGF